MKKLVYKRTHENNKIVKAMEPLDYVPSFLIPTYLAQACYHEFKPVQKTLYKREYLVDYEDGASVSLDWAIIDKQTKNHNERLLVVVHGLTGGSNTLYVRDITDSFKSNYSVVIFHARGINDTPLHTPFVYHAGLTKDIKFALNHIRSTSNFKHVFLMGISMGANITYKFLANDRSFDDYVTGFINVSNFFNQVEGIKKNTGSITDYFLHKMKLEYSIKHKDILVRNPTFDLEKVLNTRLTKEWDFEVLAKMYKFESYEQYYKQTESSSDIDKLVNIKTLILVAKDDPIVTLSKHEFQKIKESQDLILVRTEYGGHIGWFEGLNPNRWFVAKCLTFSNEVINIKLNGKYKDNNNGEEIIDNRIEK